MNNILIYLFMILHAYWKKPRYGEGELPHCDNKKYIELQMIGIFLGGWSFILSPSSTGVISLLSETRLLVY